MVNLGKLLTNGRSIFLAYDQGLEHGPKDFNLTNVDPNFIIKLAEEAHINGLVLHHGTAEKYFPVKTKRVPLIIKLNGKTRLKRGDPCSNQVCSVDRALRLGADAVGFTIYPGSEYEAIGFHDFANIVEKAHKLAIPVIAWVYPRGKGINELETETIVYAARIGLELGADIAKIQYNGDVEGFKWACKAAGRAKIVISGGHKIDDESFLRHVSEAISAGAIGTAVGRNVWQHEDPAGILARLKKVVYS